jgi:hypothetical protein
MKLQRIKFFSSYSSLLHIAQFKYHHWSWTVYKLFGPLMTWFIR